MWSNGKKIKYVLYKMTVAWLPQSSHLLIAKKIRGFWAKRIIKNIGQNVNIEKGATFTPELSIGDNSGVGINSEMLGCVEIGDNVMMGPEVIIYTRNHKFKGEGLFREQGYEESKPVVIGNNVWIGRRAMFMPGSSVGSNVVVAAGAVVTGCFGDNVIIGGVPAKVIGTIGKK